MAVSETTASRTQNTVRCAECDARLAHDQRYCLECGARRGPLPGRIAQLIAAIHERGSTAVAPVATGLADAPTRAAGPARPTEFVMPGPRAAAVAVMGMLAFGVVAGSLAGGASVETLASAPLIVVGLAHTTPAVVVQAAAGSQGDASAGAAAPAAATPPATAQQPAGVSATPSTSSTPTDTGTTPAGSSGLPPVKHVFLIVLSDRGFTQSFGAGATSGYLGGALRRQGELVQNYYAVAGAPLANEIALISGQGPTAQTATDCPSFSRITPAKQGRRGQILGTGCVYPTTTKTLANQLTTAGHTWKAYVAGVGSGARTACRVPKLGSKEPQLAARTRYLTWRNPFLYFRSLTAGSACRQSELGIGQLASDVKSASTAPALAYIIPPPCATGGDAPCKPGAPVSLAAANRFMKSVVPEIKRSAAYKDGGMIAITFDQAPQTGPHADPSACCSSPTTYPNLRELTTPPAVPPAAMGSGTTTADATTTPTTSATTTPVSTTAPPAAPVSTTTASTTATTTMTDTATTTTDTTSTPAPSLGSGETTPTGGGGQVGLLLISPYVKPGSIDVVDYFNHFSLLASIENLFGMHRLGYAGIPGLPVFGLGLYNAYTG